MKTALEISDTKYKRDRLRDQDIDTLVAKVHEMSKQNKLDFGKFTKPKAR